jgi:hypothetical protein
VWIGFALATEEALTVYDFEKVLASRKLDGAELGRIPGNMLSAFFVGDSRSIVTADRSSSVLLWKPSATVGVWRSAELYRSNDRVIYAEPDATGSLLLLLEASGMSQVSGSLYSLRANETWLDFGSEYKWLETSFTDTGEIIVSRQGSREAWAIPRLRELVEVAKQQLSPWCRPARADDWRSSRCWPASCQ